jgi:hypothetical protein
MNDPTPLPKDGVCMPEDSMEHLQKLAHGSNPAIAYIALKCMARDALDHINHLTAERDQYKQIAEIHANTIKCMQAAVNLHANRIDEIYGVKS